MPEAPPQRWWFVGVSGSGKSTYSKRVAEILDAPTLELDSLYHQANWSPLPDNQMRDEVRAFVASPRWVVDGNYRTVRSLLAPRADVVVAFALPRATVMRQITTRSLRRLVRREELWNGNKESLRNLLSLKKERNIVLWAWAMYDTYLERQAWLERLTVAYGAQFVVVRSHEEAAYEIARRLGVAPSLFLG